MRPKWTGWLYMDGSIFGTDIACKKTDPSRPVQTRPKNAPPLQPTNQPTKTKKKQLVS